MNERGFLCFASNGAGTFDRYWVPFRQQNSLSFPLDWMRAFRDLEVMFEDRSSCYVFWSDQEDGGSVSAVLSRTDGVTRRFGLAMTTKDILL